MVWLHHARTYGAVIYLLQHRLVIRGDRDSKSIYPVDFTFPVSFGVDTKPLILLSIVYDIWDVNYVSYREMEKCVIDSHSQSFLSTKKTTWSLY